jgi:hypothetical protein
MTTPEQHRRYNQSAKGKARNARRLRQRAEAQERYRRTTKGMVTAVRYELRRAHESQD